MKMRRRKETGNGAPRGRKEAQEKLRKSAFLSRALVALSRALSGGPQKPMFLKIADFQVKRPSATME